MLAIFLKAFLKMQNNLFESFFEAEPCHIKELYEAEKVCFTENPWSEGMFAEALNHPACKIYVLKDMQMTKTLAYGVMYYCEDEADLANIAVLPEIRGQGIGGKFLDKILDISREKGVLRVFLEVRESNSVARGLYLSRGFEEIGKRRKYYRNPTEDAVIMVREEK